MVQRKFVHSRAQFLVSNVRGCPDSPPPTPIMPSLEHKKPIDVEQLKLPYDCLLKRPTKKDWRFLDDQSPLIRLCSHQAPSQNFSPSKQVWVPTAENSASFEILQSTQGERVTRSSVKRAREPEDQTSQMAPPSLPPPSKRPRTITPKAPVAQSRRARTTTPKSQGGKADQPCV